ncbi:type 1 glutamine amidotransferase [Mangrovicoccus algicola]|nr:type 1 glutamine amidotransferase [Mangrovicoccus algicola]
MTAPRPRIGILKCGHVAESIETAHGTYTEWFRDFLGPQGFDMPVWAVVDGEFPDSVEACDGWLVTGSPLGAYEDHAFIPRLEAFLREIRAAGRPLVGICFGHQIIAQAFGGRVIRHPGGIKIGRQSYEVEGLGRLALNAWHGDQVVEVPEGAEIIATGEDVPVGAMRIGDRVLTLQTHPEMTNACLLGLVDLRRDTGIFAPGQVEAAEAAADEPVDSARAAEWIGDFYRRALAG